jgi:peptidoglycan hydrolase CwlO-like protein
MNIFKKKISLLLLTLAVLSVAFSTYVYAQAVTTAPATSDTSQQLQELNNKIQQLQQKVNDLKGQESTYSSQIEVMDSQIQLTEYRMNATKEEIMEITLDIDSASKRMKNLESSLGNVTKVLLNRIVATYQAGGGSDMQAIMTSTDATDLVSRANYLRIVQQHDKQLLYDTQQAKNDYQNQKTIFESKKKKVEELKVQLDDYSKQMDEEKSQKQTLLAQAKADEATSQRQLDQAKAQIAAFKSFAIARVGSGGSILPPQSSPDGWYYNQRDSRWGNNYIGNSSETVWEVGCLLSSVAMVMKKHGINVTPSEVAATSSYFYSNTAYLNLPWAGGRFTASWGENRSAIDAKLATGEPVIVGVKGGSHFVVLKSGSNGNYIMNDPWNGPDLNFSSYYSSISQYGWYNG